MKELRPKHFGSLNN